MLSIASITTDWSIVAGPDKVEPVRIMWDAIAYVTISEFRSFNESLKTLLASDYIQRVIRIRDY